MSLSEGEATELARELARNALLLEALLGSDDFWVADLHVPLATHLRVLLCDRGLPVLLVFADFKGIPLRIWGPRPARTAHNPVMLFSWTALIASWQPVGGGYEMSIRDYLDTEIAVVSAGQAGRPVTPRQVIKWVANKEGGAHFSLEKPAALQALKGSVCRSGDAAIDSFQAKQILHAIGLWTHSAIGACLGMIPPNGA